MRSPEDFFAPPAVGAPAPLREVPATPSRVIHVVDPSNGKMTATVPSMVGTVDVLLGSLEDGVGADRKEAARAGLVRLGEHVDFGATQSWTRLNSLASSWFLDDVTTIVPAIGAKLDVVMVPKVEGAEDIHDVDRLPAQLEAKARLTRPILVRPILETARGVANVEEIGTAVAADAGPVARPRRPRRRGDLEAMGDDAGAVMLDGQMEDDASLKQCRLLPDLADQLAALDPEAPS